MATLFQATGGVIGTMQPSTTWAAPNGLFPTTDRNDSSAYTWTSSTSTLTLPSTGLADGYLLLWGFETEDSSNGRYNPYAQMVQASGTGTFVSSRTGGYSRDASEDRAYVSGWSFVDNPSASSTYQFQWRRDADAPGTSDGTVRSYIQAIPFYYADIGLYSSSSQTATGGTTPVQIGSFSGTDGTNITISSSQVSVTGDNKRYLCLGSAFHSAIGNARTQRWYGFEIDGSFDHSAKGCMYYRNTANADGGESFIKLLETATATRTIEVNQYRGDGVAAGQGGADVDGNTTGSADPGSRHCMVIIELNDSAEVFASVDSVGAQEFALAGPVDVDVASTGDIEFNDATSFTRSTDTAVNCESAMDVLAFANVSHAREAGSIGSGSRWTVHGEFTVNGTEQTSVGFHGNYNRGNQSTQDCHGSSTNQAAFFSVAADDDIGVSNQELAGTEGGGGDIETQAGWVGFGLINLDTLEEAGGSDTPIEVPAGSLTISSDAPTLSVSENVVEEPGAGSVSIGEQTPVRTQDPKVWLNTTETKSGANEMTVTAFNTAGTSVTFTDPAGGLTGSLKLGVENTATGDIGWIDVTVGVSVTEEPGAGSLTLAGQQPTIDVTENLSRAPGVGSVTLAGQLPTVDNTTPAPLNYEGVTKIDCSSGNVSGSQTIPAGATFGVAMMSYYDGTGGAGPVSSLTVDGQTATAVVNLATDTTNLYVGTYLAIVSGFATGSRTIALNWTSNEVVDEGATLYITWWSGADTAALSDSDSDRNSDANAVSTSVTTASGEIVVVHTQKYFAGSAVEMTVDGSPTITSLYDDDFTKDQEIDLDYFTRTQTTHTLDVTNEGYSSQIVAVIKQSGPTDIVIEVSAGSLVLAGQAPTVAQTWSAAPGVETLTLAGAVPTVAVTENQVVSPAVVALTLTGQAPVVSLQIFVAPPVETLSLTGAAPSLLAPAIRAPPAGALDLTGQAPTFSWLIDQLAGTLILEGKSPASVPTVSGAIVVPYGFLRLYSRKGLTLGGHTPTVLVTQSVAPDEETLTLTGQAPSVLVSQSIVPSEGTLTLAGQAPTVVRADTIVTPSVTLTLTGQAPDAGGTLSALPAAGTLALAGQAPTVLTTQSATPAEATLTLTGSAPTVAQTWSASPAEATLSLTGFAPDLAAADAIVTPSSALVLAGQAPTIIVSLSAAPTVGTLTLAGQAPAISVSETVAPPAGSLTIDEKTPVRAKTPRVWLNTTETKTGADEMTVVTFNAAGTSLTFDDPAGGKTGSLKLGVENTENGDIGWIDVTVNADINPIAEPGAGSLTLTGQTPSVPLPGEDALPGAGALTLATAAPSLNYGIGGADDADSDPETGEPGIAGGVPAAALTLAGQAPTVLQTLSVLPAAGTLTLAGKEPLIAKADTVQPEAASLTLAGQAPTVLRVDGVAPAEGALTLTGQAPTLFREDTIAPAAGSLTLAGQIPDASSGEGIIPGAGTLTLSTSATTQNYTVTFSVRALTLQGYVPTFGVGSSDEIPIAVLTMVGQAPQSLRQVDNLRSSNLRLKSLTTRYRIKVLHPTED